MGVVSPHRTDVTWLTVNGVPLFENDGKLKEVIISFIDITTRKIAEDKLIESETRFRNVANSSMALIWISGTDKLCYYFNDTWLKFTGRTLEQEMGNGWAEGVHPDDFDQCLETYITSFDKQLAFEMEYRLMHNSGEYRWLLDLGTPNYDSNGNFVGYIGHCFDINERKNTEERLRESEKQLLKKTQDLEYFNNFFVNRELRMVELKKEVNELLEKLGLEKRYD